jgi:23S rRNA (pseudouridine1915-N3)-methyltransferase
MARQLHLIVVGKLKDTHLEALERDYLKRINNPEITLHELKASAENKQAEGEAIIKKIKDLGGGYVVAMSEWGKTHDSLGFANWLKGLIENEQRLIFLISGAEGFSAEVLSLAEEKASLSNLTFPHKLARLLLIEQLYRAQTIRMAHPYHN